VAIYSQLQLAEGARVGGDRTVPSAGVQEESDDGGGG
jgi:hypothetical protein